MKHKKLLISIIIILIISILYYNRNRNKIIVGSVFSGKYWDLVRIDNQKWGNEVYYLAYFNSNGNYISYYKRPNKSGNGFRIVKFETGDMVYPDKWSLENDSILIENGYKHRILVLNDTFMKIQNIYDKTRIIEYRLSKNQNPEISNN
ncbi:MAG: hypothetical protein V4548_09900 [Bacteroidota bacterium]